MKILSILLLIVAGCYSTWLHWWKAWPTADNLPIGYDMRVLEPYHQTFRVLGVERYHWDEGAKFSPVDFAVGMNRMQQPEIYQQFKITQRNRWYYWRVDQFPIPRREIEINSANMHIIPANTAVAAELKRVKPDDLVELKGVLVEISHPNGWRWRSSLTREDTGDGACELMRVDQVRWLLP
ncbi:MAG: hypothetical protein VXW65_12460 [Pseudomonadota bacterium]|nr:hypothetical protein [Pseudomonadota bacterium]